jgi:hypothetical protein
MKRIGTMLSVMVLVGSLAGTALAQDGVLSKEKLDENNYCHIKFPAMKAGTLPGDGQQLTNSSTQDVIDFYGPCNEKPTGKDQINQQRLEEQRNGTINYGG